jgi:hypothetical protein
MVAVAAAVSKTCSETVNAAFIKKALVKSLAIFKTKRPGLSFQDWLLSCDDSPSPHCHLCLGDPDGEWH